nr:MAG TPA: major tail protein [Caudoviricetes sp.]
MALDQVNADNARIWGSDDDYVAVAPIDTEFTPPTALTATAPTPFEEVGWIHPDGFTLTPTDEVAKLKGFQGGRVIRTKVTSSETSFAFQALESTLQTVGLALNIAESEATGGVTAHTLAGSRKVERRQFAIGLFDGDVKWLLHIPRGEITERQEITLGNEEITGYNLTVEIIGDYYLYTEGDPGMAAGKKSAPAGDTKKAA